MYSDSTESHVQRRVAELAPVVCRIAKHAAAGMPACVEVDDLVQSGMMGLLDAARRYQNQPGATFDTYAVQRIRGAMIDGLRQCDWLPRKARSGQRRVEKTISRLEQKNGRSPKESEVAEALGLTLSEYQRLADDSRVRQIVAYEDFGSAEDESFLERQSTGSEGDPLKMLEDRKLREALVDAIEDLPEREKLVMSLYYEQELSLNEIGEVLGVTQSRVCQIHRQSIARVRARLQM
jgi:RNA polymerase sigma factor FliA